MKTLLKERFQQLAGIKPLYEQVKKPNLKSISDVDNSDWSVDGGGGNIGYMEWEDGTEMTPQEIQDYFEVNHELYDDIMQGLENFTPDLEDDERKRKEIQQMMKGERKEYEKVTFIYTEQGGHFYGLDVYVSKDQPQRSDKLKYDEANEWLKGVLEGGDDEEVEMLKTFGIEPSGPLKYSPEEEIIPRRYNSGMEDLDLIVDRLEELGIEASHGDYMDVS